MPINFIDSKSRIKKQRDRKTALSGYYECVATHTIFYNFKTALYSSAIVMRGFTSSRKLLNQARAAEGRARLVS